MNKIVGRLAKVSLPKHIDMKFTPQLHFIADHSYDEGAYMESVFNSPQVKRDLVGDEEDEDGCSLDDVDELTIEDSILDEDISNYLMEEDLLLLQELQEQ